MEDRQKEAIPDPENLFYYGNNTNSYSGNMDRLFADDEIRSVPIGKPSKDPESKPSPPRTKSTTYFSSAAFWKNGSESVKVGVILSFLDEINGLSFLMCDASKKILKKLRVDDVRFEFTGDSLAVKLDTHSEESCVDIKFVDRLTFMNFAITTILRSTNHIHFKLFDGNGNTQIDSSCDIRYNITKHSFDDEDQLKLPDERKGVKTRLSKEKLKDHVVYKWLEGCRKGAHILIKDSSSSVFEVDVDKVRKTSDVIGPAQESKETSEEPEKVNQELPEPSNSIENEAQSSEEFLPSPEETLIQAPSPAPRLLSPSTSPSLKSEEFKEIPVPPVHDDIRDALHRIVGIELDRIEMKLNAKFEQFQSQINGRLDQQTELLQKLLEKSD